MISKKRLGALLLAGTMIMGMCTTAFAAEGGTPVIGHSDYDQTAKAPITKKLEMAEGLDVPNETFTFKVEAVTKDAPEASILPIQYNKNDDKGSPDQDGKYIIDKESEIKFGNFPHAGEFIYRVSEEKGTGEGITYSEEKYFLRVQVGESEKGNKYIKTITAEKGTEEGNNSNKVGKIVFTNTYRKNASLVIEKKTNGNKNLSFIFELSFTKSPTETNETPVYDGVIKDREGVPVQAAEIVQVKPGTPATFKLKDGQKLVFDKLPAGTKYTVTEKAVPKDGYTPKVQVTDNGVMGNVTIGKEENGLSSDEHVVGEKDNIVLFINEYQDVPVTGIIVNNLPFILLIGIAVLAFGTLAFVKKRRTSK